jgi:hypothetical protein
VIASLRSLLPLPTLELPDPTESLYGAVKRTELEAPVTGEIEANIPADAVHLFLATFSAASRTTRRPMLVTRLASVDLRLSCERC